MLVYFYVFCYSNKIRALWWKIWIKKLVEVVPSVPFNNLLLSSYLLTTGLKEYEKYLYSLFQFLLSLGKCRQNEYFFHMKYSKKFFFLGLVKTSLLNLVMQMCGRNTAKAQLFRDVQGHSEVTLSVAFAVLIINCQIYFINLFIFNCLALNINFSSSSCVTSNFCFPKIMSFANRRERCLSTYGRASLV